MLNKKEVSFIESAIHSLIDLSSDEFAKITQDKKTSMTVLGTNNGNLIIEVVYFDARIKRYTVNHISVRSIRKQKLIPKDKIKPFKPFEATKHLDTDQLGDDDV